MTNSDSLPDDVKRLICAELIGTQNLRSLWQVSSAWRAAAEPFVYRGLNWSIKFGDASTDEDAGRLTGGGIEGKYLDLARHLYINDQLKRPLPSNTASDDEEEDDDDNGDDDEEMSERPTTSHPPSKPFSGLSPLPASWSIDESTSPGFSSVMVSHYHVDRSAAELNSAPVVSAIARFKHLTDVVLQVRTRFVPGLLAQIEKYHPACRLHVRGFAFLSLHDDVTDPEERALAISGNLHSLSIKYMYRDSHGVDDYNEAAALSTVRHAKNLKHVRMLGARPASSPALYRARGTPLSQWKGFVPPIEESDDAPKAKLESLSFVGYSDNLGMKKLNKWKDVADLSSLKVLKCSTSDENFLRHVALHDEFPHLERLSLTLRANKRENLDTWWEAVDTFFASLNPLTSLHLSGSLHQSLIEVVAQRHGPTLTELKLNPWADGYDMPGPPLRITTPVMQLLASSAPNLTSVALTLKRSMGDRTETQCYEALGTLHKLQHLKLSLDCTNANQWHLSPGEDWDTFDAKTQTPPGQRPKSYNGHLKIAIVNSALDESLVKQIWDVINENRTKDTLQTLEIHTFGGSSFGNSHPGDLMDIVDHVSRHYKVTAAPETIRGVEIVELSKETREQRDASRRKHDKEMLEKHGVQTNRGSYKVFRHIWPYEDGADWRTQWKSWPLQRDDDGDGYNRITATVKTEVDSGVLSTVIIGGADD